MQAKAAMSHGEWGRLFEEKLVPFGIRSAQMLMAIAEHPQLSNTKHVSLLPRSWGTLYELTKVPEPVLDRAFQDRVITPDMARKAVQALLPARPARTPTTNGTANPVEPEGAPVEVPVATNPESDALHHAQTAISELEQIRDDDRHRKEAYDLVREWLRAHVGI
jgi:hypothetical protein